METGLEFAKKALRLEPVDARSFSPLALAYIGDAVYELAIRTQMCIRDRGQPVVRDLVVRR